MGITSVLLLKKSQEEAYTSVSYALALKKSAWLKPTLVLIGLSEVQ
jgi:hypothetical protein